MNASNIITERYNHCKGKSRGNEESLWWADMALVAALEGDYAHAVEYAVEATEICCAWRNFAPVIADAAQVANMNR